MFFEITAPLGALGLTRGLPAGARAEFERSATLLTDGRPSVILSGPDREATVEAFRDDPYVAEFERLGESNGETVHRLTWRSEVPDLVSRVRETDCTVLSGVATVDEWSFELRFPTEDAASEFYGAYEDGANPITLQRTRPFGLAGGAERDVLTPKQSTALREAFAVGYFDVPRRATLDDVAATLGVSDTATSQRLRRGMANLLRVSPHVAGEQIPADDD